MARDDLSADLIDRLQIEDVIKRYSRAIDHGDWDGLDEVFTPDATFDFRAIADFAGDDLDSFRAWLRDGLSPMVGRYFHLCVASSIDVTGDEARATSICLNPMPLDGGTLFGHWYVDQLVRTDRGWRIRGRRLDPVFEARLPS